MGYIPGLSWLPLKGNRIVAKPMSTMRRIGLALVQRKKKSVRQTLDGSRDEKDIGHNQVAGRDLVTALVRANMSNDLAPRTGWTTRWCSLRSGPSSSPGTRRPGRPSHGRYMLFRCTRTCRASWGSGGGAALLPIFTTGHGRARRHRLPGSGRARGYGFHAPMRATIRIASVDDEIPILSPFHDERACCAPPSASARATVLLYTLLREFTFEMAEEGMQIEARATIVTRPVVKGRENEGPALPLRVRRVAEGSYAVHVMAVGASRLRSRGVKRSWSGPRCKRSVYIERRAI
ncbi:hypothetical protein CALCODRAFT_508741 [Calocera cornea HHB12733]|uniref:Uncharacterized protein n=1 Tax=Calocera cornea HHB12733 TaxID=1353952 RepID=A0A165G355_9BASI|nr:hypothetical protein CALCODRAFT_508741 [Calocera cornea HHB12733]